MPATRRARRSSACFRIGHSGYSGWGRQRSMCISVRTSSARDDCAFSTCLTPRSRARSVPLGAVETRALIDRIAAEGDRAYTLGFSGMHIFDASTPAAPSEIGYYRQDFGRGELASDVAATGHFVLLRTARGILV